MTLSSVLVLFVLFRCIPSLVLLTISKMKGFGKTFKTVTSLGISPKRMRNFRRKFRLTGKQIKRKLGLSRVNSAAGVNSDSIYGPTGSIIGRY